MLPKPLPGKAHPTKGFRRMPPTLALLCPPEDARHLGAILATANQDLVLVTAADAAGLERTVAEAGGVDRIAAFWTNSIVPAELLRRVRGPSYCQAT